MGNLKFRLSNIITRFWLCRRKSLAPKSQFSEKPRQSASNKALPVQSFDEMLLLSSSFRLCPETDHALAPPTISQPRRASVYNSSSNHDDSPRRRKVHTKCCNGARLKLKSPRPNALKNMHKAATASSSSFSSGFMTVVKSSANPERDFRESMVEMIVENNITDLDELEELLVSYLLLNSDEFHEVIVRVFKDIVIKLIAKKSNNSIIRYAQAN